MKGIERAIKYMHEQSYRGESYKVICDVLQTELERQENKPLSLKEMSEMDGHTAWVVYDNQPGCVPVILAWVVEEINKVYVVDRFGKQHLSADDVKFYRYKPHWEPTWYEMGVGEDEN